MNFLIDLLIFIGIIIKKSSQSKICLDLSFLVLYGFSVYGVYLLFDREGDERALQHRAPKKPRDREDRDR